MLRYYAYIGIVIALILAIGGAAGILGSRIKSATSADTYPTCAEALSC